MGGSVLAAMAVGGVIFYNSQMTRSPQPTPIFASPVTPSSQIISVENYLRFEIPKKNPNLKELLDNIKPTIQKIDANQIIISYDSLAHQDYSSESGLRIITALFMGRLKGNPKENIIGYKNLSFRKLIVYNQQSEAVLTSDDWDAYVKSQVESEDALYSKIQITAR